MEKSDKVCGCENKEVKDSCGCGHDHEHDHEEGNTITLTLDDNTELECSVLGTFDIEETEYIVLLPLGDEEVLIYKYEEVDGEISLGLIESDEEFNIVSETFYSIFGSEDDDQEDEA